MASAPSRLKSHLIGRQTAMDNNRLSLRHDPHTISQFGKQPTNLKCRDFSQSLRRTCSTLGLSFFVAHARPMFVAEFSRFAGPHVNSKSEIG
jgi:hypothetical protein